MSTYRIENRRNEYQGFLTLETATIRVLDEDGREKICATRERLLRPHSAAVLLYNIDKDAFVFTNQFRYPISDSNAQFLLEIPARESRKMSLLRLLLNEKL